MRRITVGLLLTVVGLWAWGSVATAQGEVEVRNTSARSEFPTGITFTLEAASPAGFDEVRLTYEIAPDGVPASAVPDCVGDTTVTCTFQLGASQRNLLIPGAEVTYFWELTVAGETQETAPQTLTYEDDRFAWRTVSDGNLTLSWYAGSEEEARRVLAAARQSLDEISALLQTTVPFPIKVFYYASAFEMQPAIIADNAEGVVTLGEVVYSDTAMVAADAAPEEIARHEIAHIVVREALSGPFDVPDWLNEGTAVFAQLEPLPDQRQALERAIANGDVLTVRSLSSASSGALADRVSLYYGQSGSLVQFLVDTYEPERFAELFRVFKEGATTEDALQQVYGFGQDELENRWRESVGLPPRQLPTPEEERAPTAPAPTSEPEATTASDEDGGAPIVLVAVIGALAVALAGLLLGTGLYLARRWR